MKIINYEDNDFQKNAWSVFDQNDDVEIVIPKNLSENLEKALNSYINYYKHKKNNIKSWKSLTKLAWFGMRTPVLWGVINHAEINGFNLSSWIFNDKNQLIIKFDRNQRNNE